MIDPKTVLTNKVFCPIPWTGLMFNFDGRIKNCIRSAGSIGDIKHNDIEDILHSDHNHLTQSAMLANKPGADCHPCYDLERNHNSFNIISDRIFYIKELKTVPLDTYRFDNHELHTIDVRWSNLCNFACVYCGPSFSSRWAQEISDHRELPTTEQIDRFKQYILDRAANLKHVYMAGGEPLLMKQNQELLEILAEKNPNVCLRINTNLSKVDTRIFEMICEFTNVHWTVSVESMDQEFEYIRYGGSWQDFQRNLKLIQQRHHKISFNMLHLLLNPFSLFDCVDWLVDQGFHANSFIIGPILTPIYLNIRHLPDHVLKSVQQEIAQRLECKPGYLLENSYKNLYNYLGQPFDKDLRGCLDNIAAMDRRRGLDSRKIFKKLYDLI